MLLVMSPVMFPLPPLRNQEKSTRGFFPKLTQTKTRTAEKYESDQIELKMSARD